MAIITNVGLFSSVVFGKSAGIDQACKNIESFFKAHPDHRQQMEVMAQRAKRGLLFGDIVAFAGIDAFSKPGASEEAVKTAMWQTANRINDMDDSEQDALIAKAEDALFAAQLA
jgi:hypothetical protein